MCALSFLLRNFLTAFVKNSKTGDLSWKCSHFSKMHNQEVFVRTGSHFQECKERKHLFEFVRILLECENRKYLFERIRVCEKSKNRDCRLNLLVPVCFVVWHNCFEVKLSAFFCLKCVTVRKVCWSLWEYRIFIFTSVWRRGLHNFCVFRSVQPRALHA